MTTAVVLVAAGMGQRLGAAGPKALVEVNGRPLLELALDRVRAAGPDELVVVATPGHERRFASVTAAFDVDAIVSGGDTRTASVRAGLAALGRDADVVAVHDAARALAPAAVIRAAIEAVRGGAIAAAPAIPVVDTLKRVHDDEVVATVGRGGLRAVQTPQVFRRDVLEAALEADEDATDDLALVERAREEGRVTGTIRLVRGSVWATKVTYPEDLALVTALAREPAP